MYSVGSSSIMKLDLLKPQYAAQQSVIATRFFLVLVDTVKGRKFSLILSKGKNFCKAPLGNQPCPL